MYFRYEINFVMINSDITIISYLHVLFAILYFNKSDWNAFETQVLSFFHRVIILEKQKFVCKSHNFNVSLFIIFYFIERDKLFYLITRKFLYGNLHYDFGYYISWDFLLLHIYNLLLNTLHISDSLRSF